MPCLQQGTRNHHGIGYRRSGGGNLNSLNMNCTAPEPRPTTTQNTTPSADPYGDMIKRVDGMTLDQARDAYKKLMAMYPQTDIYLKRTCIEYYKHRNPGKPVPGMNSRGELTDHGIALVAEVYKDLGCTGPVWFTSEFVGKLQEKANNLKQGNGADGWRPGAGLRHRPNEIKGQAFVAAMDEVNGLLARHGFSSYNESIFLGMAIERRFKAEGASLT
jgi:hypothetical protein